MKGGSNIISGINCLKQAYEHFSSFQREHPGTKGALLFSAYNRKIDWIYNDLITHPMLSDDVREGVKNEWNGDSFIIDAIAEQAALLSPQQREWLERVIELLLQGETIEIVNE